MNNFDPYTLKNKSHVFEDGVIIKVVEVKQRNDTIWITYESIFGKMHLPRRLILRIDDFLDAFGHLFPETENKD